MWQTREYLSLGAPGQLHSGALDPDDVPYKCEGVHVWEILAYAKLNMFLYCRISTNLLYFHIHYDLWRIFSRMLFFYLIYLTRKSPLTF